MPLASTSGAAGAIAGSGAQSFHNSSAKASASGQSSRGAAGEEGRLSPAGAAGARGMSRPTRRGEYTGKIAKSDGTTPLMFEPA